MKRLLSILIVLLTMITILGIYGNAEEAGTDTSERTIMDVLVDAAAEQELQEKFFNEKMLPEEYVGYSIEGKPVLVTVLYQSFEWKADDIVGTFAKMWNDQAFVLLAFTVVESAPTREGIKSISYLAENDVNKDHDRMGKLRFDKSPFLTKYMATLLTEPAVQTFLGQEYTINNVFIVGDQTMPNKIYFTDGGVFIRPLGPGKGYGEYTWEDFVPYYNAYVAWCAEQRYNEDGEPLFGGVTPDFGEFVNDIYPTWTPKTDSDIPQYTWMIWGGVGVLVCCIVVVVFIRKRKSSPMRQSEESPE